MWGGCVVKIKVGVCMWGVGGGGCVVKIKVGICVSEYIGMSAST